LNVISSNVLKIMHKEKMAHQENASLSNLLLKCAVYVERDESHADLYTALGQLHAYIGKHASNLPNSSSSTSSSNENDHTNINKNFEKDPNIETTTSTNNRKKDDKTKDEIFSADITAELDKPTPILQHVADRNKNGRGTDKPEIRVGVKSSSDLENVAREFNDAAKIDSSNKSRKIRSVSNSRDDRSRSTATSNNATKNARDNTGTVAHRPAFQRPVNPNSNLVANGWIEQKRRSKTHPEKWKDVLFSVVDGRRPEEETTLWIQQQVNNPQTKQPELKALHQIPVKWIENAMTLKVCPDFRFMLKVRGSVKGATEEFTFRTLDANSCREWVVTLISSRDAVLRAKLNTGTGTNSTEKGKEMEAVGYGNTSEQRDQQWQYNEPPERRKQQQQQQQQQQQ